MRMLWVVIGLCAVMISCVPYHVGSRIDNRTVRPVSVAMRRYYERGGYYMDDTYSFKWLTPSEMERFGSYNYWLEYDVIVRKDSARVRFPFLGDGRSLFVVEDGVVILNCEYKNLSEKYPCELLAVLEQGGVPLNMCEVDSTAEIHRWKTVADTQKWWEW